MSVTQRACWSTDCSNTIPLPWWKVGVRICSSCVEREEHEQVTLIRGRDIQKDIAKLESELLHLDEPLGAKILEAFDDDIEKLRQAEIYSIRGALCRIRLEHEAKVLQERQPLPEWFTKALSEDCSGPRVDAVLDVIFDQFDRLLTDGNFLEADRLLNEATQHCSTLSTDVMIAFLTITCAAATRLPSRSAFFQAVQAELHNRGETDEKILQGLGTKHEDLFLEAVPKYGVIGEFLRGELSWVLTSTTMPTPIHLESLRLSHRFVQDLGADSLTIVELALAAEEKLNIKVFDEEIENLHTIGDVLLFLRERA